MVETFNPTFKLFALSGGSDAKTMGVTFAPGCESRPRIDRSPCETFTT